MHFMEYDAGCGSPPWRDRVTGLCRTGSVDADVESCWLDGDQDGLINARDNCALSPNGVVNRLAFQTTTGGQLDDDADGYGNVCDGDFDGDGVTNAADEGELLASMGKLRSASNCGTSGTRRCAIFDLDGLGLAITQPDFSRFNQLEGSPPGPKGPEAPLDCVGPGC
jgi:hypothetical protein